MYNLIVLIDWTTCDIQIVAASSDEIICDQISQLRNKTEANKPQCEEH